VVGSEMSLGVGVRVGVTFLWRVQGQVCRDVVGVGVIFLWRVRGQVCRDVVGVGAGAGVLRRVGGCEGMASAQEAPW